MIKKYFLINLVFTLIFSPLFYVLSAEQHLVGYFIGGTLISINMAFLVLVGQRIFLKKSIAQTITLIVFKYALLGVFIYRGMAHEAITQLGFILGVSTSVPSLVFFVIKHPHLEVGK